MNTFLRRLYFALIGLFLAAPIIVVAGVSVNEKQSLNFPPQGFSLGWYGEIFANPEWRNALFASLTLAILSAALAVLIALPLAWFLWRRIAPWANIFQLLGIAPFTLPPVITALGMLTFWATTGFYGAPWTAVISHAIFFVTLPLVTLSLGFTSIDRSFVEAAATMGADDRTVFTTVVLPLIRPYLISGYAFAFVLSLNEYIVAYMTDRFHDGDLADQDLQRTALRLHADHGVGNDPVRRDRGPHLRADRPLRRSSEATGRDGGREVSGTLPVQP